MFNVGTFLLIVQSQYDSASIRLKMNPSRISEQNDRPTEPMEKTTPTTMDAAEAMMPPMTMFLIALFMVLLFLL